MGIGFVYASALLFGLGVLMVWFSVFTVPARQVGLRGDLEEIDFVAGRRLTVLGEKTFLARAFGPLLAGWSAQIMGLLNRAETDREKLKRAGWPAPWHTLEDFYASKVMAAGVLGSVGVAVALLAAPQAVFILVPALGGLGFFVPDLSLNGQVKKRREAIITEMAFVPDRIAIQVQAGKTLPIAIREVASKPGGPLVHQLRQVSADYAVDGDLTGALEAMAERTGIPELRDFTGRIRLATAQGTSIAPLLKVMGASARERLNLALERRAMRNSLLMIVPVGGLVLPAILILLAAPGFYMFFAGGVTF